jgi:hypothetical protein
MGSLCKREGRRGRVTVGAMVTEVETAAMRFQKVPKAKECGWPAEVGKGKETDSF